MGEIIDLTLVSDARRFFHKLLDTRGLNYFLHRDGQRLFQIEQSKVEMVVRTAARSTCPARRSTRWITAARRSAGSSSAASSRRCSRPDSETGEPPAPGEPRPPRAVAAPWASRRVSPRDRPGAALR
jgi:hypothetical protein